MPKKFHVSERVVEVGLIDLLPAVSPGVSIALLLGLWPSTGYAPVSVMPLTMLAVLMVTTLALVASPVIRVEASVWWWVGRGQRWYSEWGLPWGR